MSDRKRHIACYCALVGALIVLLAAGLLAGSSRLSPTGVLDALLGRGAPASVAIVRNIRLPRLLAAVLLGGALSVSGYLLQTFFGNPIAGPFVLGISSGAKLFVALALVVFLQAGRTMPSSAMILAAFCGAMLSMAFILLASRFLRSMPLLIVCGVMIGYICSAVTDLVVTFADDSNIVNLHNWSMGSFSGIGWRDVRISAVTVFAAVLFAFLLSKPMSAYRLGEAYAQSMGVSVRRFRIELILLSSILSGCVTAFAGPISFVGIAVPHLMRSLFRSSEPILMVPACFLGGSAFCLFCDLIARTLFSPTEMSISSVTAIFGAPIVIWMLIAGKRDA